MFTYLETCRTEGGLAALPTLASCLPSELTNREAQDLSCVMGQRDSHPGKQGQWGPSVHLGPHPTPLPCPARCLHRPSPAAPKGLQYVWLPPPLNHHRLGTSFPLLFQRGDECSQDRRAEGRKCCPALHRAQACPVRRLHMVVPGCFLVTRLAREWRCVKRLPASLSLSEP